MAAREEAGTSKRGWIGETIHVSMFGGFSIRCGDHVLTENSGRTNKVWMLIELLVANHGGELSQEKLIETLWRDEEYDNPLNTLKNLVYRARTTLKGLIGGENVEFIQFERNTYAWNRMIPLRVDADEFEALWKAASDKHQPVKERIRQYQGAVALYHGEFLPKSSFLDWVIVKNAYFTTIYTECVMSLIDLLCKEEDYEEVVRVCEQAIEYCPYEEDIHRTLLYGYYKTNRQKMAVTHYAYITQLFYNQFGVHLSDDTVKLYKEIVKSMHNVEMDLTLIKEDLRESSKVPGAFLCDYDTFRNIYRLQARSMLRTGSSIHIALLTLTDLNGDVPHTDTIRRMMASFQEAVVKNLRKGDVVSVYSSTQLVIMLPMTSYENGQRVLDRLEKQFDRLNRRKELKLIRMLHAVEPVEEELKAFVTR